MTLAVLDLTGGSAVLAGHADRPPPLLDRLGVVGHRHRVGAAQVLDHVITDPVAQRVDVPFRAVQQVLDAVGGGVPDMVGQLPGVLSRHVGQKATDQIREAGSGLGPGEQRADDPRGQRGIPGHDQIVGEG